MPIVAVATELLLLFIPIVCVLSNSKKFIMNTPSGKIEGVNVNVEGLPGATTYQFRKIPYAKPPIGDLRFKKPQQLEPWRNTLDATAFGPSCIQPLRSLSISSKILPNTNISEDCLFLNIYVPTKIDSIRKKTVMVWIHGGGYMIGQGMVYDPSYMSVKGDVIVVTINYRLGMFGFATLKNDILKGNYGLWDQIMALRWIKKNINAFGGDPDSITIFGESAGGFSVSLQALIPSNKGLFHRVIAQSGVANSLFATSLSEPNYTIAIGNKVGCNGNNPNVFLNCLKLTSADLILNATTSYQNQVPDAIHILGLSAPVVDNELLMDSPENLLRNTSSEALIFFQSLDVIIGNLDSEGSLILGAFTTEVQRKFNFNSTRGLPYNVFCENVVKTLTIDYFSSNVEVKNAICKKYGVTDNESKQAMGAVNMFTDLFFMSVGVSALRFHAKSYPNNKTYQYIFSYHNKVSSAVPPWFRGASHGSEISYLFELRSLPRLFNFTITPSDLKISNEMVLYWTNFAKTGNPNGANLTSWPILKSGVESFLVLDKDVRSGTKYENSRIQFWLDKIPTLMHGDRHTSTSTTPEPTYWLCYISFLIIVCFIYSKSIRFYV